MAFHYDLERRLLCQVMTSEAKLNDPIADMEVFSFGKSRGRVLCWNSEVVHVLTVGCRARLAGVTVHS